MTMKKTFFEVYVETDHPVAVDSPDHICPWGTSRDNNTNFYFNRKLYHLFSHVHRSLRVLDLGCSGGGFVRSLIDEGCLAIGLEGSDYSKKMCRAEWPFLGDKFLFTTDIAKPFHIRAEKKLLIQFDVITAWEVLEHIKEEDLDQVCRNIKCHLMPSGLLIVSISSDEEVIRGIKLHQTVKSRNWWINYFASQGLWHFPEYKKYFNTQYVRGPKQNAPGSFHLVLSMEPNERPSIPKTKWKYRLYEKWLGSKPCRILRMLAGLY